MANRQVHEEVKVRN